jgi:hypothetical protein
VHAMQPSMPCVDPRCYMRHVESALRFRDASRRTSQMHLPAALLLLCTALPAYAGAFKSKHVRALNHKTFASSVLESEVRILSKLRRRGS